MRASFEASYTEMQSTNRGSTSSAPKRPRSSVCLTELSPAYVLLNEDGDAYDSL